MQNKLLYIAFFTFVVIAMPFGLLNIAFTYMQDTFDVSLESLGILLMAIILGRLITTFTGGQLIAKFGLPNVLIVGTAVGIASAFGYMLSPAWVILLVAAFCGGAGLGIVDIAANTFISARYLPRHLNLAHACFGVGLTISPPIVTFAEESLHLSWRWGYAVFTVAAFVLLTLFFITRHEWVIGEQTTTENSTASIKETLALPVVILSIILFFLDGGAELGVGQLSNTLFVDSRNLSQETATMWISLYWGCFTITRALVGLFVQNAAPQVIVRTGFSIAIIGSLLLWINLSLIISMFGYLMMAMGFAPIIPTLLAVTPKRVGIRHAANTIGFTLAFAGLGSAILPGLAGALAANTHLELIAAFFVVIIFAMLLCYEFILWRESRPIPVAVDTI